MIQETFKDRMFKEIEVLGISTLQSVKNEESLLAVHVLKECILPYHKELDQIIHEVIPKKSNRKI